MFVRLPAFFAAHSRRILSTSPLVLQTVSRLSCLLLLTVAFGFGLQYPALAGKTDDGYPKIVSVTADDSSIWAGYPTTFTVTFDRHIFHSVNISTTGPINIAYNSVFVDGTSARIQAWGTFTNSTADAAATVTLVAGDANIWSTQGSTSITVHPIFINSVVCSPALVLGGQNETATVTLNHAI